jgi:Cu(I)/Ag(I) efflux system membrane fusion protein
MWTGERSIVYEKIESNDGVGFRMREVVLGPSLGDRYVIKSGLEAGMEIVTNGTFTIDAAAQLSGKPSMMNPEDGEEMKDHKHGESQPESSSNKIGSIDTKFQNQLKDLLNAYLKVKDALVATDATMAAKEVTTFIQSLKKIDMTLLSNDAHDIWMPLYNEMKSAAENVSKSDDIEEQRKSFLKISDSYFTAVSTFQLSGLQAYYQYCPMAFNNKGGHWISKEKEISNPYFGSKMMRCGETIKELN